MYENTIFLNDCFYDCADVYTCFFYKCTLGVPGLTAWESDAAFMILLECEDTSVINSVVDNKNLTYLLIVNYDQD